MKNLILLAFLFCIPAAAADQAPEQFISEVYGLDSLFYAALDDSVPGDLPPELNDIAVKARIDGLYRQYFCGQALNEFEAALAENSLSNENWEEPLFISKPKKMYPVKISLNQNEASAEVFIMGIVEEIFSTVCDFSPSGLPLFYDRFNITSPPLEKVAAFLERNRLRGYDIVINSAIVDSFELLMTANGWRVSKWVRTCSQSTLRLEQ